MDRHKRKTFDEIITHRSADGIERDMWWPAGFTPLTPPNATDDSELYMCVYFYISIYGALDKFLRIIRFVKLIQILDAKLEFVQKLISSISYDGRTNISFVNVRMISKYI